MNWKPISEKPKKDGWYLGWCPGASVDNWDPVRWFEGRWLDDTCLTHWAEITGPEDCCEWTPLHRDESGNPQFYKTKTCGYRSEKQFFESNHCPNCGRKIKEVK